MNVNKDYCSPKCITVFSQVHQTFLKDFITRRFFIIFKDHLEKST